MMTTQRSRPISYQQSQHRHRPPDVEEALSSMLWTPYERTPTDSSSEEDDDERLNKRLRRSQSAFDYRSLPSNLQIPLSNTYFGADDTILMHTTSSPGTPAPGDKTMTICQAATPIIPFVPFNDLFYNHQHQHRHHNLNLNQQQQQQQQQHQPHPCYNNNNRCRDARINQNQGYSTIATIALPTLPLSLSPSQSASPSTPPPSQSQSLGTTLTTTTITTATTTANYQFRNNKDDGSSSSSNGVGGSFNYRFSYPYYGQIPSLHKWWSTSGRVAVATTSLSNKEPPSYESLYAATSKSTVACASLETSSGNLSATTTTLAVEEVEAILHKHSDKVTHKNPPRSHHQREISGNASPRLQQLASECNETSFDELREESGNCRPYRGDLKAAVCERENNNNDADITDRNNSTSSDNQDCSRHQDIVGEEILSFKVTQCNQTWRWPNSYYECEESEVFPSFTNFYTPPSACAAAVTTDELIPNKCLAELERLYAEFRASESQIERALKGSVPASASASTSESLGRKPEVGSLEKETETETKTDSNCDNLVDKMRLNIPANEAIKEMDNSPNVTPKSTSLVFLNTTNCETTTHNSNNNNNTVAILTTGDHFQQQTPSGLTIQVNEVTGKNEERPQHQQQKLDKCLAHNNNNNNNISVINCSYGKQHVANEFCNTSLRNHGSGSSNNNNNCREQDNNNFVVAQSNGVGSGSNVSVNNCSSVPNLCNVNTNTNLKNNNNHININNNNNCISSAINGDRRHCVDVVENFVNNNHSNNYPSGNNNTITNSNSDSVQIINVNNVTENSKSTITSKTTKTTEKPTTSTTRVPPKASPSNTQSPTIIATTERTFTSTESQTDDISSSRPHSNPSPRQPQSSAAPCGLTAAPTPSNREQRRRERRERRQQQTNLAPNLMPPLHPRRLQERHSLPPTAAVTHLHPPHLHHPPANGATMSNGMSTILRPMLPDLLHSHYPPPYSALPNGSGPMAMSLIPPPGSSLLGHSPGTGSGATVPGPPPPPIPGTTILTPVISTVPIPGATPIVGDGRFTLPLPLIRRSPSERSGKGCCGQWFAGPPLRALIAVVALGGVACALGGAALGATGLAGPPSSHLTAALLMIGVGVVLVTVSGAAWRMTAPGGPPCLGLGSSVDLGRCGRRPCSRGGAASHGLLYPEFQHRPPPPSYQASMQEYRLRLLLLDRDRQTGVVRGSSPPPTYRSHAGSLLRAPLTTTSRLVTGTCSSSIGGSEYSLPPSYRSRHQSATTATTMCSERSIETAPSGSLLANEDIPEPLSVEQLPEYNRAISTKNFTNQNHNNNNNSNHNNNNNNNNNNNHTNEILTSAIVEVEISPNVKRLNHNENSSNARNTKNSTNKNHSPILSSSTNSKELVTIVTISQPTNDLRSDSQTSRNTATSPITDHIEILAHL